jgi:4-amino-4-deoxy-L-arabinose transferase-like glycosyltransferase
VGRSVWGVRAAALSALTLLTTVEFFALGRFGDLNMLLTLFVTAGVLGVHGWANRDGRGRASCSPRSRRRLVR